MPAWQSDALEHVDRHAPLVALHWYAPHDVPLADSVQLFAAEHVRGRLSFPTHDGVPHDVPTGHVAHARFPSHWPVSPHVDAGCPAHSESGSVPEATAPQTPSAPVPFFDAEHASHAPAHAVSQQKPSTQLPLAHSAAS